MPGLEHLPGHTRVQFPGWRYLGGTSYTNPNDQELLVPSDCCAFIISSEGGALYYEINGAHANATSGGYIPDTGTAVIWAIINLTSFRIHGGSTVAHITFWGEG